MLSNYLTLKEASEKLGIKIPTLRKWIENGIIKAKKFNNGKLLYIHIDDINAKIKELED